MAIIEEDNSCSGICLGDAEKPGPLYVYSNVNNGKPKISCKKALEEYVLDLIDQYVLQFLAITLLPCIVQLIMLVILFWRIYKFCCHKRQRNRDKENNRHRAANGMVV